MTSNKVEISKKNSSAKSTRNDNQEKKNPFPLLKKTFGLMKKKKTHGRLICQRKQIPLASAANCSAD
jgi:hypothetical protein